MLALPVGLEPTPSSFEDWCPSNWTTEAYSIARYGTEPCLPSPTSPFVTTATSSVCYRRNEGASQGVLSLYTNFANLVTWDANEHI